MGTESTREGITAAVEADLAEIGRLTERIRERLASIPAQESVPEENHDFLTRAEAARRLRVSEGTVKNLNRSGEIPVVRIGRRVLIAADDLDVFLSSKQAS